MNNFQPLAPFPKQGDTIYVLWSTTSDNFETMEEPFKALVIDCVTDYSASTDILARGTLHYWPTKEYDSCSHVVQFLKGRRVRSTFSAQPFDGTPTPWSYSADDFLENTNDDNVYEYRICETNKQIPGKTELLATNVEVVQSDLHALTLKVKVLEDKVQYLASSFLTPQENVINGLLESVRSYATVSLLREFQRRCRGCVRRNSRNNSIRDKSATSIGPIVCNFVQTSTPCSFSTFQMLYTELGRSLSRHPVHAPVCIPEKPNRNFRSPMHSAYTLICPTFIALSTALGIKSSDVRKALLLSNSEEGLRLIGTFLTCSTDDRKPGFLLLGAAGFEYNDLFQQDDMKNDNSQRPSISTARIQTTEIIEEDFQFINHFQNEERSIPFNFPQNAPGTIDQLKYMFISWTGRKSLKRTYEGMVSTTDTLGELKVSIPTCTTTSSNIREQISSLFTASSISQCVTLQ